MMRKLATVLLLVVLTILARAQSGVSKLGASLKLYLAESNKDPRFFSFRNNDTLIATFIEVREGVSPLSLVKNDVNVRSVIGTMATADIPINKIAKISSLPEVKRIELPLLFRKTDSLMKRFVTVDKVHAGTAPLDRVYKGKGTVIGIIDDGIDITHPDFLDTAGKTKVKSLWNMDRSGVPPAGYAYGHVWVPDSINSYIERYKAGTFAPPPYGVYEMQRYFGGGGHGTPVASLAAGKYGIAPESEIVVVALTAFADTLLRSDRIIDGISFIYQQAKQAGKKCVINISLGIMDGAPHDGRSFVERAIDEFCSERPDILVCTSAGNNGNTGKHWGGFPIHADSTYGFFRCAYQGSMYFAIPKQYSSTLRISLTDSKLGNINNPNISRDSIFYQSPFVTIADIIQSPVPITFMSKLPNGWPSSTISFSASHYNSDYDELIIKVIEHTSSPQGVIFDDHLYRFIFKGTGTVHGWYPFWNLHPIYYFGNNPNDSTYRSGDNNYTTVIPTHAFTVLSSGAYNIRDCYVSVINNQYVSLYEPCRLTHWTSRGPTQDGRIKPDIISPGEGIFAARSRMDNFVGHYFIIDSSTREFSGTSASSPITAGVAALVWERYPDFDRDSIISLIKGSANFDNLSSGYGNFPNNVAGWGKIDAFKAMTGESTNTAPLCAIKQECKVIPVPPQPQAGPDSFKIFPVPANPSIKIGYRSRESYFISIYNVEGRLVGQERLNPSDVYTTKEVSVAHLPSGYYVLRFWNLQNSFTRELIIAR